MYSRYSKNTNKAVPPSYGGSMYSAPPAAPDVNESGRGNGNSGRGFVSIAENDRLFTSRERAEREQSAPERTATLRSRGDQYQKRDEQKPPPEDEKTPASGLEAITGGLGKLFTGEDVLLAAMIIMLLSEGERANPLPLIGLLLLM